MRKSERSRHIMPTPDPSLKTLVLSALLAVGGTVFAQSGDPWYGGRATGFWGLSESVGVHGAVPGMFNLPGTNPDSLNVQRQYGGQRTPPAFSTESAPTKFRPPGSPRGGDFLSGGS